MKKLIVVAMLMLLSSVCLARETITCDLCNLQIEENTGSLMYLEHRYNPRLLKVKYFDVCRNCTQKIYKLIDGIQGAIK